MISQVIVLPKLAPRERAIERIGKVLIALAQECAWKVEIEEWKPRRTNQQNAYLWGVCYRELMKALEGWEAEDIHEYMLGECYGWEERAIFGKRRIKPIHRSSKLLTTEFSDFIAFVQRRAAEHGAYIPDPEEEFT